MYGVKSHNLVINISTPSTTHKKHFKNYILIEIPCGKDVLKSSL
jgi:hypothetical protein